MKNEVKTVWSNRYEDIEELVKDLGQEYPGYSEDELYQLANELNSDYLMDERINLRKTFCTEIVGLADIGRWNGRVSGYKEFGNELSECLYPGRDAEICHWFCDDYNFKCDEWHHDGCNHITYRLRRPDITDSQWEHFLDKLYYNTASDRDIRRYTVSLRPYVAEVYGW